MLEVLEIVKITNKCKHTIHFSSIVMNYAFVLLRFIFFLNLSWAPSSIYWRPTNYFVIIKFNLYKL